MMWFAILGMFLMTALVTWGFFVNMEDSRNEKELEVHEGSYVLSDRLNESLCSSETVEEAAQDDLRSVMKL